MAAFTSILSNLCCTENIPPPGRDILSFQMIVNKEPKPTFRPSCSPPSQSREAIVADVITILRSAEKQGLVLTQQLDDAVEAEGWTEWIAEKVLDGVMNVLKEGREKMGPAMVEAYDKACEAADVLFQFAQDHPLATAGLLAIVAVGVLVILAPTIVEVLGFAEFGPVEGMW